MKIKQFIFWGFLTIGLGSVLLGQVRAETETTPTPSVEYVLPYPGILPDNPLYVLKKFRDAILELIIADPVKKSEFYLLQSDKHLNAAVLLLVKEKKELAVAELTKSDTQLQKSLGKLNELGAGGRDWPGEVSEKLAKALVKRREMYGIWQSSQTGVLSETVGNLLVKQSTYEEELTQLTVDK